MVEGSCQEEDSYHQVEVDSYLVAVVGSFLVALACGWLPCDC